MQHLFRTKRDLYILPLSVFFNILLVMFLFSLCRWIFLAENFFFFSEMTLESKLECFKGGLLFDISAVLYLNLLYIVLAFLPVPFRKNRGYEAILKLSFVIPNSLGILSNLFDVVFFPFSNGRSSVSIFSDYRGEDNLNGIIAVELVNHWYLTLAFVLIVLALIVFYAHLDSKLWLRIKFLNRRSVVVSDMKYCVFSLFMLFVLALPIVCGIRGGLGSHRPLDVNDANRYVVKPKQSAIVLNTPFSIFRSIGFKSFAVPSFFEESERSKMESYFTPIHFSNDTVEFKPLNVVLIIMESFGREASAYLNSDFEDVNGCTPFLDSLMMKSLTYKHSFANGCISIDAMPSILSGIPMFEEHLLRTKFSASDISGIGGELASKGYYTAFFHGAKNGSLGIESFIRHIGYSDYFGRNEYGKWLGHDDSDDYDGIWGIWDEPFFQFMAEEMDTFKEPFCVSVFSVSSHHPYNIPKEYANAFPEENNLIRRCVRYSDNALQAFFGRISHSEWFNRTIFVIVGDHPNRDSNNRPFLKEYQNDVGIFAVPVVFYYPGGENTSDALPNELNVESIAQQCDIMPTVLGFLGYDSPFVAFGCNLFTTPPEQTFAINYNDGIYQFFKGDYLLQFDGSSSVGLYRFREDINLNNNLVGTLPEIQEEMEKETCSIIQQYMERMNSNQMTCRK